MNTPMWLAIGTMFGLITIVIGCLGFTGPAWFSGALTIIIFCGAGMDI